MQRMAKRLIHRGILVLMPALAWLLSPAAAAAGDYQLTTIAEGLELPWCITLLPDGDFLVTERPGRLRRLGADGNIGEPITGVPPVLFAGQGGLHDVLLDPDFAENGTIYLSYAHGDMRANGTRIARATLRGDTLENVEPIFTAEPLKRGPQHFGAKMVLLPDRTLMLTTGDGFDYRELAQNPFVTLGKTIRINTDGSIPADNPFADGADGHPAVYSYGHRNPQGLARDPVSGVIYQHEHGPRGGDEVNRIEPGRNYGWPAITYGVDYSGAYVSPFTEHPGMEQPLRYWVPSIAPSGLAVYTGALFPDWQGSLLVGALNEGEVRRVTIEEDGSTSEEAVFSEVAERVRDVRVGPDGTIYLVTDPGRILRVSR
jgi:glucose/arabinose dehydrogenase